MSRPKPKQFDTDKHHQIIARLDKYMPKKEFEAFCEVIALDILENYENFEMIEKGPNFRGTPFDFFGFKDGAPYIIELKGSLKSFNTPGETQKWRLKELLRTFDGLNIALLQVKLRKAEYRIFYNEDMEILFRGKKAPLEPVQEWIRERI
jgi:hypothetical protein